jgi:hypothetical protein
MFQEVHPVMQRVLGEEDHRTMMAERNLASALSRQGQHAAAEQNLRNLLPREHRPDTAPALMRSEPATMARVLGNAGARTAGTVPTQPRLPDGTRIVLQRLVGKPEYNGQRARVLSFDERRRRYAVALDDCKELSLEPECVVRAGCAAVGCASEDVSSVCGRCQAVRYCSRECQRADWKAHKPACTAAQTAQAP